MGKRFPPSRFDNCKLTYVNTIGCENPTEMLKESANGGYDDVLVMVSVPSLFTMAEERLETAVSYGSDACLQEGSNPPIVKDIKEIYNKVKIKKV